MKKILLLLLLCCAALLTACGAPKAEEPETPPQQNQPSEPVDVTPAPDPAPQQTTEQTTDPTPQTQPQKNADTTSKGYAITTVDGATYIDGVLVVNKTYAMPQSCEPGGLTSACSDAFDRMAADADADGICLWAQSGFRPYDMQARIYQSYCDSDGQTNADRYSARPGHSEHETGLAIDLNTIADDFGETAEGRWAAAHCADYGFILRYPYGKEEQTGYQYEPWHIRYVGEKYAHAITDSGLCLEEYFGITSAY
jgi:D-alanyl-D-alanine carboxypeptidase